MLFVALSVTACGSMSNMSEQDAYDIGYGLGKAAGYCYTNYTIYTIYTRTAATV